MIDCEVFFNIGYRRYLTPCSKGKPSRSPSDEADFGYIEDDSARVSMVGTPTAKPSGGGTSSMTPLNGLWAPPHHPPHPAPILPIPDPARALRQAAPTKRSRSPKKDKIDDKRRRTDDNTGKRDTRIARTSDITRGSGQIQIDKPQSRDRISRRSYHSSSQAYSRNG